MDDDDDFLATSSDSDAGEDANGFDAGFDADFSADFDSQRKPPRRAFRCFDWCLACVVFGLTAASLLLLAQAVAQRQGQPASTPMPVTTPAPVTRAPATTLAPLSSAPSSTSAPQPPSSAPTTTSSPVPPTESPTTLSPTHQPSVHFVADNDSPVSSFDDARYGLPTMNITNRRRQQWLHYVHERINDLPKLITDKMRIAGGDGCDATRNAVFDAFCERQRNASMPVKYLFPRFPMSPIGSPTAGVGFDPSFVQRHLRQFRHALAEYYEQDEPLAWWYPVLPGEFPVGGRQRRLGYQPPRQPPVMADGHRASIERVALILYRVIKEKRKKLVMGFMGSSVMSGQDNCHDFIYPEQMKRRMDELLSFADIKVEVRNMGQNGDGPDMPNQVLCSLDTMGDDVDLLTLWYPMIPMPRGEEWLVFLLRWLAQGMHVHLMHFPIVDSLLREGWTSVLGCCNGFMAWYEQGEYGRAFNWPCGSWGRHGDGRCHTRTREGAPGVYMQNWHFGPLGFQVLVDSALVLYTDALVMAMDFIKGARPLPVLNTTVHFACMKPPSANDSLLPFLLRDFDPTVPQRDCDTSMFASQLKAACGTGFGPRFTQYSDLKAAWHVPLGDASNPFGAANASLSQWNWVRVKNPSRGWGYEREWYVYQQPALRCDDFPDVADAFINQAPLTTRTDWLTFRMLGKVRDKLAGSKSMRVLVCYGSRSGNWGIHPGWTLHYGHNGKHVGAPIALVGPYYFSNVSCSIYVRTRTGYSRDAVPHRRCQRARARCGRRVWRLR